MKVKFILLFFFLNFPRVFCQLNFDYEAISLPENEKINAIGDIIEDTKGHYWIATNDGLYRFNGYQFLKIEKGEKFPAPENDLKQLSEGSEGEIWVLSNSRKLYLFNTLNLDFKEVNISTVKGNISRLISNPEYLYLSTDVGGVYKYEKGKLKEITHRPYGESLLVQFLSDGQLWLKEESEEQIVSLNTHTGEFVEVLKANAVWHVSGIVYYVDDHGNVFNYTENNSFHSRIENNGARIKHVDSRNNRVMISSYHGKLFFNNAGRNFMNLSDELDKKLGKQKFLTNYLDHNNTMWIGTSKMIYRIIPRETTYITTLLSEDLLYNYEVGNSMRALYQLDSNRVLLGSYNGFFIYDILHDTVFPYPLRIKNRNYKELDVPFMDFHRFKDGTLLGVTEGDYLLAIDLENQTCFSFYPQNVNVSRLLLTITAYDDSTLLIGGNKGLYLFNAADSSFGRVQNRELYFDDHEIWDILPLEDHKYAIASDSGIFIIKDKILHHVKNFGDIPIGSVTDFAQTKEGIFAGCYHGLIRFNKNWEPKLFMKNFQVYSILEDGDRLWLGTNKGLIIFYPATNSWFHFDKDDGLSADEFNRKSYLKLNDGRILMGGINGVNIIDTKKILNDSTEKKIYFSQVNYLSNTDTIIHHKITDHFKKEWQYLTASFTYRDEKFESNFNVWVKYDDKWEWHTGKILKLDKNKSSGKPILVKLQFPNGEYSNILKVNAFDSFVLWPYVPAALALVFVGFYFFNRNKKHKNRSNSIIDDEVPQPLIPEEYLGKKIEVLFVKPCDMVEEDVIRKLYIIQKEIIENPQETEINAEYLASRIHTSERQLYRIFKESVGLTPRQFTNKVRLRNSLYLIYSGNYATVTEVAEAAGFKKASYYSRLFKEEYHKSPKTYLRKV